MFHFGFARLLDCVRDCLPDEVSRDFAPIADGVRDLFLADSHSIGQVVRLPSVLFDMVDERVRHLWNQVQSRNLFQVLVVVFPLFFDML